MTKNNKPKCMSHCDKRVRGLVTEGVHGNGRILTWGSPWTRDLDQQNMAQNLEINWGNVVNPPIDLTALTFVTRSPTGRTQNSPTSVPDSKKTRLSRALGYDLSLKSIRTTRRLGVAFTPKDGVHGI